MEDRLFTPEQVAQFLQLHPMTILRMIKKKEIKAMRIGRVYRIMKEDLDDYLKRMKV